LGRGSFIRQSSVSAQGVRLPELDGIRGLAIVGVLLSHGARMTGIFVSMPQSIVAWLYRFAVVPLWGGVDLFFVLSGFLITGILLKTKNARNYFSNFYIRRILRIFPIYYMVLIGSLLIGNYSMRIYSALPPSTFWKISYFLYLQNWPCFWHGERAMTGLWGAYWSLAVEEQYYLLWPLAVALLSRRVLVWICIIGFAFALPLRLFLSFSYFGTDFGLAQITTSRIDGLLAGSACSIYMFETGKPIPRKLIGSLAVAGLAIMSYIAIFHTLELVGTSIWMHTVGITGYALLSTSLVALSQHHYSRVQKILTAPALRSAGKYSYGMYVYHVLVLLPLSVYVQSSNGWWTRANFISGFLFMTLELGIVFVIAKLSYDFVEQRFLRLKEYFAK